MKIIKRIFALPFIFSLLVILLFPMAFVNGSSDETPIGNTDTVITGSNDVTTIDINLPSYKKLNPLWPKFNGQCTWFAWSRANQLCNVKMPTRDAKYWYELAKGMGFKVGSTPSKNSVMVITGSKYGHVAFIEAYDGTNITVSEGNVNWSGSSWRPSSGSVGVGTWAPDSEVIKHIRVSSHNYEQYKKDLLTRGRRIAGFIYT